MYNHLESIFFFIKDIISSIGYVGIGSGMLLESACIPLPSELVLPLAGFMISDGKITMYGANIAVTLGSLCGSLIAYAIGYYGGRPFILKYGKYFFVSEKKFTQSERTFKKFGCAAVLFGRLLPVIRTFISLPAGIARINLNKFIIYSLLGMIPWNFILIFLGYKFGQQYDVLISPIFHKFEYIVIGFLIIAMFIFIIKHFLNPRKKEQV